MLMSATLSELALYWNTATTDRLSLRIVSYALLNPDLDDYIDQHKEGWIGVDGKFARILARVRQAALL